MTFTEEPRGKTFDDFAEDLFQHGIKEAYKEPYLYGSYEIYEADIQN